MKKPKQKPVHLNIKVDKTGTVKVDPEEFFAHPDVVKQVNLMKKINFVGAKLDFNASQGRGDDTSTDK